MTKNRLGATGEYPRGNLGPGDEGGLGIAVGAYMTTLGPKVRVDFGTPVAWIGFDPDQARQLGETLIKHAEAAMQRSKPKSP